MGKQAQLVAFCATLRDRRVIHRPSATHLKKKLAALFVSIGLAHPRLPKQTA